MNLFLRQSCKLSHQLFRADLIKSDFQKHIASHRLSGKHHAFPEGLVRDFVAGLKIRVPCRRRCILRRSAGSLRSCTDTAAKGKLPHIPDARAFFILFRNFIQKARGAVAVGGAVQQPALTLG